MTRPLTELRAINPSPRRGLSREEAALFVGVSQTVLLSIVATNRMPRPWRVEGQEIWDLKKLSTYLIERRNDWVDSHWGTVYVLGFDRYVKIGFTKNLQQRMETLQTGLPVRLKIVAERAGTTEDERELHRRFAAQRANGEWFIVKGELRKWIRQGCPL